MYCMCVRGEGVGTRAAPSLPSLCVLMEITHSSDHLYHSRLTPTAEGPRGDAETRRVTILFGSQVGSEIGTLGSAIAWVSEESLW